jgi:hypothetical protein
MGLWHSLDLTGPFCLQAVVIRQVPLTRKDAPEDKDGFEAQRGDDLDFCIFELGAFFGGKDLPHTCVTFSSPALLADVGLFVFIVTEFGSNQQLGGSPP